MHVDMGFVFWPCTQDMATRRGQFGQLCWLHSATYDITIPGNDVVGHIILTAWVSKFATLTADDHPFPDGLIPLRCHRLHAERDLVDIKAVFFFWWSKWLEIMTDWNWENDRMCVCVCVCFCWRRIYGPVELACFYHTCRMLRNWGGVGWAGVGGDDNVPCIGTHVQSATEWTASVQTLHMPKHVM